MTLSYNSADASFYYYEQAAADFAKMDSSAVYGNLADAMKDSIVLLPADTAAATLVLFDEHDDESEGDEEAWAVLTIPA
jgi:hypothetical protein